MILQALDPVVSKIRGSQNEISNYESVNFSRDRSQPSNTPLEKARSVSAQVLIADEYFNTNTD